MICGSNDLPPLTNLFSLFFSKYKYIIKKLQHLISLLSYNQSNMNLEEMVRFLTNIQTTYNQLLTGYLGVFYVLKKCQYKQMCFDCAIVTGQLQKLMMETNYTTNYTSDLTQIHLSNRTIQYLQHKFNKKYNHTALGKMKRKTLKKPHLSSDRFVAYNSTSGQRTVNLTQILNINKMLLTQFNRLLKRAELNKTSKSNKFKDQKTNLKTKLVPPTKNDTKMSKS